MEDKLRKIKCIAFDIDGVMTDGTLLALPDGDFLRMFDAKDGFAVRMAVMHGYIVACITGASSESVIKRLKASGVDPSNIYMHSRNKIDDFNRLCEHHNLSPDEVMYFGDDLPDAETMQVCGLSIAPADACEEAKAAADYVSPYGGGKGCIRHGIELVMKTQGTWFLDTDVYKAKF